MRTQIYFPEKTGTETVTEFIWHAVSDSVATKSMTAPFLKCEVIFNFGDIFSIDQAGSRQVTFLSGLTDRPFLTTVEGSYATVGMMLQPDVFYRRFGIPMILLENKSVDLTAVLGNSATALYEEIGNESCVDKKLKIAEAFFYPKHFKRELPAFIINFLKQAEAGSLQKGQVKSCADTFGISSKHLIQTFKEIFGVTPHQYIRLFHFNKALNAMFRPEISHDSCDSFFDQSHFTGIFREFTGVMPTKYTKAFVKKHVNASFPNTRILEG